MKTVQLMLENDISLRKALAHSGSSRQLYYYRPKARRVSLDASVVEGVKQVSLKRPSFGTRRMAAVLTRELGTPVNRKKVQRIFRALNWVSPSMKKSEIIRPADRAPKPSRPHELWQMDLTYVWTGRDSWGYLFNVFDAFSREWAGYQFDTTATKENAIISVENSLIAHKDKITDPHLLTLRADNGPQYTSHTFRESIKALGLKLEHIAYRTPEQNGSIESFHKTIKKEYVWPSDFQSFQEAERAIGDAFRDYNENRIHSSLGYLTPYEFLELWYDGEKREMEKMLNVK